MNSGLLLVSTKKKISILTRLFVLFINALAGHNLNDSSVIRANTATTVQIIKHYKRRQKAGKVGNPGLQAY